MAMPSPFVPQPPQWLGRSDAGVILMRKLWQEELQALADGRPIRRWDRAENSVWAQIKARAAGTPELVG